MAFRKVENGKWYEGFWWLKLMTSFIFKYEHVRKCGIKIYMYLCSIPPHADLNIQHNQPSKTFYPLSLKLCLVLWCDEFSFFLCVLLLFVCYVWCWHSVCVCMFVCQTLILSIFGGLPPHTPKHDFVEQESRRVKRKSNGLQQFECRFGSALVVLLNM